MTASNKRYRFEILTSAHNVSAFECGNKNLDAYLRNEALKDMRSNLRRTYVCLDAKDSPASIVGYFTLCTDAVIFPVGRLREEVLFPLIHLCWFARDKTRYGTRVGSVLLLEAFRITARVAEQVGVAGLHIREATREGRKFFTRVEHGFVIHPADDIIIGLYVPIETVRAYADAASKVDETEVT